MFGEGSLWTAAAARASHPVDAPHGEPWRSEHGRHVVDLEAEIRMLLTAAGRSARRRSVMLQMALEPGLAVETDASVLRACLRSLVADAIGRAEGGVLVTAVRQDAAVDVELLDDGPGRSDVAMPLAVPEGGSITAQAQSGGGTKVLLRLPLPTPV